MPSKKLKENLAVADFETNPFKKGRGLADDPIAPFCVGAFDGKLMQVFWGSGPECCHWLINFSKKHRGIIYMHNGGNFDFHFLLEFLPVADCKFFCVGKRIVELTTPWGARFRDSYAIIPKALGAYAKESIDYRIFEKHRREKHRARIISYLESDLQNLWDMLAGFVQRFPLTLTLASAVFKIMEKDFGHKPPRMSARFDGIFRPYFFGGRVQFWRLGRCPGPHHLIDMNSAYPAAMALPHWYGGGAQVIAKLPKKNFEQCFFDVSCLSLGALPLRSPGGGVDFPETYGRFKCTGWELAYGLESGRIADLTVHLCYQPAEVRDFAKFVHHYYSEKNAARARGDKPGEFFAKNVLNTGYGRYAIQPLRFKEIALAAYGDTPDQEKGTAPWVPKFDDEARGLAFFARSSYREGIDKFVNVATAASITGAQRAALLRAMDQCGGVVYCDTDSIIAADLGGLVLSDALGQWKSEGCFPGTRAGNSFWIAGKKLYAGYITRPGGRREWKTAAKGVKLTPAQIIDIAQGKVRQATSLAPTYSVFSAPKFVQRTIRRADQQT